MKMRARRFMYLLLSFVFLATTMLGFSRPASAASSSPTITSPGSTMFVVGGQGSFTVTATGSPTLLLSQTGAPSWVTFTDKGNGTATITGMPPSGSAGTYQFTITASNDVTPVATQSFTLSTLAWENITGSESFNYPYGIAVDSSNHVYVADPIDGSIRELVNGRWTTISNWEDFYNGYPYGIAVDSSNHVYVADWLGIKELVNGRWTSITGSGGPSKPWGIAVDSSGDVYAGDDTYGHIYELVNGDSNWEDITGSGSFDDINGIAVDSSGQVYLSDYQEGIFELVNGSWENISSNSELVYMGVAVDSSGDVYTTEFTTPNYNRIYELVKGDSNWEDITGSGSFDEVNGIAVDSSGQVYVVSGNNNTIMELTGAPAQISPTSATFDKYTGDTQYHAPIQMNVTPNGNTLTSITNNGTALVAGTDYVSVSDDVYDIQTSYLDNLSAGTTPVDLTFNFSDHNPQSLAVTVEDTTPAQDSTISPTSATFDKYAGDTQYNKAIAVTVTPNGNTLESITNGSYTLVSGTDYSVSSDVCTINTSYLDNLPPGTTPVGLTFNFSAGAVQTLAVTVEDTTPSVQNSTISPASATFDKYAGDTQYNKAIAVTVTPNGNTLESITNGPNALSLSNGDYSVSSDVYTINPSYLDTLSVAGSPADLTFNFSAGVVQTLVVTLENTTPAQNSTISPTSATFDKYAGDTQYNKAIAVTVTPNGNTLESITNGSYPLVSGTDYSVSSDVCTIDTSYLDTLTVGGSPVDLTFNFSAGVVQTLVVTLENTTPAQNSTISPASATFDKYAGDTQYNKAIAVTVTPNGNTLESITNGSYTLVSGTDYSVSSDVYTINPSYLDTLSVAGSPVDLTFNFSAGAVQTLVVTVENTTPAQNSTISPTSATFDKYAGDTQYNKAIAVTVTPNGNTLESITNGSYTLVSGTDYSVSSDVCTIDTSYLDTLTVGGSPVDLTFNFSAGVVQTLVVTLENTTPAQNSTISPTSATFDKYAGDTQYNKAIAVTVTPNGNTLESITNGSYTLVSGTDYSVSSDVYTINPSYLDTLTVGESPVDLTFNFSAGAVQTLVVTVENTTPAQNSTISPASATFDKYAGDTQYNKAIAVTVTPNGNTLESITNGSYTLVSGTDYSVSSDVYTINPSYLDTLSVAGSPADLTFNFSAGVVQTLVVTLENTTPAQNSTIGPTTATFDKYAGDTTNHAAIAVTVNPNGNTLTSITNGGYTLTSTGASPDYSVSNNVYTINTSYLDTLSVGTATLTFKFSAGSSAILDITVLNTSSWNNLVWTLPATVNTTTTAALPVDSSGAYTGSGVPPGTSVEGSLAQTGPVPATPVRLYFLKNGQPITETDVQLFVPAPSGKWYNVAVGGYGAKGGFDLNTGLAAIGSMPLSVRIVATDAAASGKYELAVGTPGSDGLSLNTVVSQSSDITLTAASPGSMGGGGAPAALAITTTSLPPGTVGQFYNQAITTNDEGTAPYNFTVTGGSLPPGLTLDADTGVLSGTPTKAGTYTFTVTVKDANGNSASENYALTVNSVGVTPPVTPPPTPQVTLKDIGGSWAQASINKLVVMGVVTGYLDGTFRPNNDVTRAEFATMLERALKLTPKPGHVFPDTEGTWARGYISTAADYGIVKGYDAAHFGPNDLITREQMAAMVVRAARLTRVSGGLTFKDAAMIDAWAREDVSTGVKDGIIHGYPDGTFRPLNHATRAEAAMVIAAIVK